MTAAIPFCPYNPPMWFDIGPTKTDWTAATRHLRRVDPVMAGIIKTVGPCTLTRRRDYFVVLCKSIVSQQISTAVATVLFGRFRNHFPQRRPTPKRTIEFLKTADPLLIRGCGLSRQKAVYLLDLAEHFEAGKIPVRKFNSMTDEQIIDCLDGVKGIGRWTVEMFLIFVLNRPDVYPVDDLGIRKGVQRAYGLSTLPNAKELNEIGEKWRPHRSLATWYLWRMPTPVKGVEKAVAGEAITDV